MRIPAKKFRDKQFFYYPESNFSVTLRPFPFSEAVIGPGATVGENLERTFVYCVISWDGLADDEGNALECNDENKKLVYDFVPPLREWILVKIQELTQELNASLGN